MTNTRKATNMKTIVLATSLAVLSSSAYAGMRCSKDYFGNVTCRGTGQDSGYSSRTTEDYFGNTTTRDNRGNTVRCRKDYFGNVTCD